MSTVANRRAPHEGQNPRRLHENATSFSWAQSTQRTRRNPWATDAAFEKGLELIPDKLCYSFPSQLERP